MDILEYESSGTAGRNHKSETWAKDQFTSFASMCYSLADDSDEEQVGNHILELEVWFGAFYLLGPKHFCRKSWHCFNLLHCIHFGVHDVKFGHTCPIHTRIIISGRNIMAGCQHAMCWQHNMELEMRTHCVLAKRLKKGMCLSFHVQLPTDVNTLIQTIALWHNSRYTVAKFVVWTSSIIQ